MSRVLDSGGFANRPGEDDRPDATAWAVAALRASGSNPVLVGPACTRLAGNQQPDGRVCVSPQNPEAWWPTPLAVMAWQGISRFDDSRSRALDFLLNSSGRHWARARDNVVGHDPSLKGWSYIEGTHSWVVPTSLTLLALKASMLGGHERAVQAVAMLLDRRLPSGGWNYGNTKIFGRDLYAMPDTTGMALDALSGLVSREDVESGLACMKSQVRDVRTPLSLSWGLLGLGAWGERPADARAMLSESWEQRRFFGEYDTATVGLMTAAWFAGGGMDGILSGRAPG